MSRHFSPRVSALLVASFLVAGACTSDNEPTAANGSESSLASGDPQRADDSADAGSDSDGSDATATTAQTTTTEPTTTLPPTTLPPADLDVLVGFEQLTITDAEPGTDIVVLTSEGEELARSTVSPSGSTLIRELAPGSVLVEVHDGDTPIAAGPTVAVSGSSPPDPRVFDQEISSGFGYIETRDGTTLSMNVTLPGSIEDGPYPTLFEYSGYEPSNPGADDPSRLLIPTLGYALVQVNVRGTGCSGGSFDAFEPIQALDGYDVIETLARQSWVDGIGMWGISYPGIMQLHVAASQPPSLDAIAPLSALDQVDSVLYPGGIFNDGFGQAWTSQVSRRAEAEGQAWARDRIAAGDDECEANQELREHNPDLIAEIESRPFRDDFVDSRSAVTRASQIDVPVFLAGAWQDEQTGGHFPAMLDELEAAPVLRAYLYNGLHIDPLGPDVLVPLIEFYDIYVGQQAPGIDAITRVVAAAGLSTIFGAPVVLPPDNYRGLSLSEAREAFESEPPIRVLFEVGATAPNVPVARFETALEAWPSPALEPKRFYLVGNDGLFVDPVASRGTPSFFSDPEEGTRVTVDDLDQIWTPNPGWTWEAAGSTNRIDFTSGVIGEELVLVGPASVDLWVTVAGDDGDIEATLIEVAPDGTETYIQAGWLRLSRRALAEDATDLRPALSLGENDIALLSPDEEPVLARIEILPFAHVLRPDSRLRLTLDTPGGSRPQWTFDVLDDITRITVHTGGDYESSVLLPVLPGVDAPDDRPECGSLRGQPCRAG